MILMKFLLGKKSKLFLHPSLYQRAYYVGIVAE